MIAGRKLLLADDSAAVQKVVELTFADEGMEVFSVGDGQAALEKLEHFTPDVVLADAFMPGISGYELCRSIKGDQRFAQIPVMLLVSSFAPFDEAEAQRAGADDIMTKPFQSIKQLIKRVDSLLGETRPLADSKNSQPLDDAQPQSDPAIPGVVEHDEPQVTVLVEAAQLETALPHESNDGSACAPDIEFQTADTARLEPAVAEAGAEISQDTLEIEPQIDDSRISEFVTEEMPAQDVFAYTSDISMNETVTSNEPMRPRFSDALLDLDERPFAASAIDDDVILDLDLDEPAPAHYQSLSRPVDEFEPVAPVAATETFGTLVESSPVVDYATDEAAQAPARTEAAPLTGETELSADVINAIARRVIEQMSDKVVREIAWEVVPELSELIIRKKLDQG